MDVPELKNLLEQHFQPTYLEVIDTSAAHAKHIESQQHGGAHYKVVIVAPAFVGLSRLKRHQLIYDLLAPHFKDKIHALALTTLAPDEYHK